MTVNGMELVSKIESMEDNEILYSRLTSMKDAQRSQLFSKSEKKKKKPYFVAFLNI